MAHTVTTVRAPNAARRPAVSWGAVFAGTVVGSAILLLLSLLVSGAAVGHPGSTFAQHLGWWLGGAAIVCTFAAGFLAAAFSGSSGPGVGLVQGLTVWGLLTLVALAAASGAVTAFRAMVSASPVDAPEAWLWSTFWSVLAGLVAATLGGLTGSGLAAAEEDAFVVQTSSDRPTWVDRDEDEPSQFRLVDGPVGDRDPATAAERIPS